MQGQLRNSPTRIYFPGTCPLGHTKTQADNNGEAPQFTDELTIMPSSLYMGESETGLSLYI